MKKLYPIIFLLAIIPAVCALTYFSIPATSWNITIGAGGGNINDTWSVGGGYIWINETGGAPAFQTNLNITIQNIPDVCIPQYIAIYNWYQGNPAHIIEVQALNQTSKNWVVLGRLPNRADYGWDNFSLVAQDSTLFLTCPAEVRIIHTSPGNVNHWLRIDFISIITIGDTEPSLSPWDINWITALIWLTLTAIGVFKGNKIMIIFAGFFGLILGLLLMTTSSMISVALICLNLYLIYEGTG